MEGYSEQMFARFVSLAKVSLVQIQAMEVITGMDRGWQQAAALAALELKIPLIAAIPFAGQDKDWQASDSERWEAILFQTRSIIHVEGLRDYEAQTVEDKLKKRDKWMTDYSDEVLALHDGRKDDIFESLEYAKKQNKVVFNVWKSWVKYGNS